MIGCNGFITHQDSHQPVEVHITRMRTPSTHFPQCCYAICPVLLLNKLVFY